METGLTVFSFGAGQDSTTILHKLCWDPAFRKRHVFGRLIVVGSDTGDEHRHTYEHIEKMKIMCKYTGVEFYWITPDMGFHSRTWQSLFGQYNKNKSIGSSSFKQSCTDKLKIRVVDNFVEHYIKTTFNIEGSRKKAYYTFAKEHGQIRLILGFAKGEERRTANGNKFDAKWKKATVYRCFPLIEEGIDRQGCIDYNEANFEHKIFPSNCMRCFYQSRQEILWLFKNEPQKFWEWVEAEKAKKSKYGDVEKNYGVYGTKDLEQILQEAIDQFGHWSDEQLEEYKYSHGHCMKSKY